MKPALKYSWRSDGVNHSIVMAHVEGTRGRPFLFGEGGERRAIEIAGFFMAIVPVTQALWTHIMGKGSNPTHFRGERRPVEGVSWHDVTVPTVRVLKAGRKLGLKAHWPDRRGR